VIAASVISLFVSASARASYLSDCSASLTEQWRDEVATHPTDPSKHTVVVSIDIPVGEPEIHYRQAIDRLKRAFPSFEEGFGSGILVGCCAVPVWGSVSLHDLTQLSDARFESLCDVGRRSQSTSVGLRVEYREIYERHEGAAPYFFVSWRSPFWHPRVRG
jgi:hypothetical protein